MKLKAGLNSCKTTTDCCKTVVDHCKTIVIVGPTASGKTGVAIETAKRLKRELGVEAEIISADSRAIYREMDLGTAKPSPQERAEVKHWGLDIAWPAERFTVADWKEYAERKILEIRERGNLPMIVGGTGLYIDALIYDYKFTEQVKNSQDDRAEVCTNYLTIGVLTPRDVLRDRIYERANKLFNDELYKETEQLAQKYGWDNQAMKSNIYQFAWKYMQGRISREDAVRLNAVDDWHLARRQLTWFKRNKNINWLALDKIPEFVIKCIQDEQRK